MNCKGQNLIEYILMVVAVLIVCIFFLRPQGPMGQSVNGTLNDMVKMIDGVNSQITLTNPN